MGSLKEQMSRMGGGQSRPWVYLDNSATTALCPAAREAMERAMDAYGNPSSLHGMGQEAHRLVSRARDQVALALGLRSTRPGELIFTASGTEASNTAILGGVYAKTHRVGRRIITTDCEHPSVEETMKRLEADGFEVVRIPTRGGVLDTEAALAALEVPTLLVSMMLVNNETGAVFDVATVFKAAKARNPATLTHCDAVQGFLKVPFTPAGIGADMVTVSGHKVHGPKGVGALYISPALLQARAVRPYLIGGGQEDGLRSGTENTVGICGFGAAAAQGAAHRQAHIACMTGLRDDLTGRLVRMGVQVNLPRGARAPHIVNLTLPGIKSQTMLNFLSERGVCVSSGSACSSHGGHTSRSLLAFGLTAGEADCSLRVSLCETNTPSDLDALCRGLEEGLERLVRIKRDP